MRKLLKEISVIPGVAGSCIFDKKEGALCKDMHPSLSQDLLETVGINLVRLIQIGGMSNFNVKTAHFRFDKYTVVGMPLDTGSVLLTLCDAQANCSLIATTAAMLAADMQDELEKGVEEPDVPFDDVMDLESFELDVPPEEIPVSDPAESNAVEANSGAEPRDQDLQPVLDRIEQALAGAIGPVAGMVMQDYVDKWKAAGPVVPARLSELANMLIEEIGEKELEQEFLTSVENIM